MRPAGLRSIVFGAPQENIDLASIRRPPRRPRQASPSGSREHRLQLVRAGALDNEELEGYVLRHLEEDELAVALAAEAGRGRPVFRRELKGEEGGSNEDEVHGRETSGV